MLAAARELEAIKAIPNESTQDDIKYFCYKAIWDYCKKNPEIIEFYREKDDEDEEDIINDLWFIDIIIYEMETQKE